MKRFVLTLVLEAAVLGIAAGQGPPLLLLIAASF